MECPRGQSKWSSGGLHLLKSNNNEWTKVKQLFDGSELLPGWRHDNHFDSLNVALYDINNDMYNIYVRHNNPEKRQVQYTTTKDFHDFSNFKLVNINNFSYQIYAPNIFMYPMSKYFIGLPCYADNNNTHNLNDKKGLLMFSTDGINFDILDYDICCDQTKQNREQWGHQGPLAWT